MELPNQIESISIARATNAAHYEEPERPAEPAE